MTTPPLNEIPIASAIPPHPGRCYITMSPGQWDTLLRVAYDEGWILLEIDDHERPVRAFRRAPQA